MRVCCRIMALTLLLSRPQIDLEPEGKVFVVIDLTGSSSEGRKSPSCSSSSSSSYEPAASSFSLRNFLFRLFSAHDLSLSTSQQHLGSNAGCGAAHPSQWCKKQNEKDREEVMEAEGTMATITSHWIRKCLFIDRPVKKSDFLKTI